MSELPKGWAVATLGHVSLDCAQHIPADDEHFLYIDIASIDRGGKSITSPQALLGKDAPSRARKLVAENDVLVSMTRPNLNAVALVPKTLDGQIASTGFDVLRAITIDPRWIFYTVRSANFVERMCELVQGALYPAVRGKDIRDYQFPLAPLPEQKRIADKLDSTLARVDACRDRLDRLPALLKRFRQSVLAAATSGRLTKDWRAAKALKEGEDYPSRALADLLSKDRTGLKTGPFGSLLNKSEHQKTGINVVGIENIDDGRFIPGSKIKISQLKADELSGYDLQFGDIVISRSGTVGEICAIPKGAGELRFSTNIIRVSLDTNAILPEYFVALFRGCPEVLRQVEELCKGSTRMFLNQAIMKAIRYPTPPVEEQYEIVHLVETLFTFADRLEARLSTARKQVERLTPALLAKAFRGELVPQDPNDEPATELLKRLAACRAEAPKAKRGRKAAAV